MLGIFSKKKVLITGGTGSLGVALTKKILKEDIDTIRIFSRDEWKQVNLQNSISDERLRFFIGDVRDGNRLHKALEDIDIVIHTAALKHVPIAEYNPFEAIKTNVFGTQNLIEGCLDNEVSLAIAVGTDKAVAPLNTYGATKLLMERLFVSANYYKGRHKTIFSCVRYGNVMGSRGSIIPYVADRINQNKSIKITDPKMTRFNITMNEALDLIFRGLKNPIPGQILIPKLKSYKLEDLINVIVEMSGKRVKIEKTAVRAGEKYHESLITANEIRNTYETKRDYIVYEKQSFIKNIDILKNKSISKSDLTQDYSSDKVPLLTKEEIRNLLVNEKLVKF